ncbi:MAG: GNAT family acetyltransferase [Microgenomates group bacterium Gr01-1014_16]|nr:MAG: GNAT family acetyltransferase [Microgenomates group bacterium Gr01-1014_16]
MNITVREYLDSEKTLVQSFIEKLQDYVVATDPIKRIRNLPGLSELGLNNVLEKLDKNKGKIYFAQDEGKVVGYIFGFVCDKQSEEKLLEVVPSQVGQIEDVYVEEEYRGKGVGKMLMEKMEDYLKDQGCDSIWLEVFAPNFDAHAAYLKMGYVDREVGMLKRLI